MSTAVLRVDVECYAGYRDEEAPTRFRLGERTIEIDEVIDRWLAPDHRYFKVRAKNEIYILRNDVMTSVWEITMYTRDSRAT